MEEFRSSAALLLEHPVLNVQQCRIHNIRLRLHFNQVSLEAAPRGGSQPGGDQSARLRC